MGKALRLLRADPADSGSYSCKAVNIAGSAEKDFFVAVLGEWGQRRTRLGEWRDFVGPEPEVPGPQEHRP